MRRIALYIIFSLALCSCAPKYTTVSPDLRTQMLGDLAAGKLSLDCGIDCYWSFIRNDDALNLLHQAGRWQDLAVGTMQIGHQNDVAYYYLGRAAEELGYLDAAEKYYKYSAALYSDAVSQHHCREMSSCYVDVADVVPRRLGMVREKMVRKDIHNDGLQVQRPNVTTAPKRTRGIAITRDMANSAKLKAENGGSRLFVSKKFSSGHPVTSPHYVMGVIEDVSFGDLNGDNVADAAIICWYGNGSATKRYYINVITGASGQVVSTMPMFVGDRMFLESFGISSGEIVLRAKAWASPTRTRAVSGAFVLKKGKIVVK